MTQDNQIETITENRQPHYQPYGWHHWPDYPWFAYQFRRGLGETQEGGGAVSEVFQAASRMVPGPKLEPWSFRRETRPCPNGDELLFACR